MKHCKELRSKLGKTPLPPAVDPSEKGDVKRENTQKISFALRHYPTILRLHNQVHPEHLFHTVRMLPEKSTHVFILYKVIKNWPGNCGHPTMCGYHLSKLNEHYVIASKRQGSDKLWWQKMELKRRLERDEERIVSSTDSSDSDTSRVLRLVGEGNEFVGPRAHKFRQKVSLLKNVIWEALISTL